MAIYHLKVGFISRSSGRSSVQSAAYITGEKLKESRRDLTCFYKNKISDVALTETLSLHSNADLSIWDCLETFEDLYASQRYLSDETQQKYINSAQTAMTMVIALPKELPLEESKDLVKDFANQRFVSRGLVVTYALHKDEGNPHVHLQISRRALNEKGEISKIKDREICTKKALLETRKLWADLTNSYLEKNGLTERITHKSFVDIGLDLIPSNHRGWFADRLGDASRIVQENKAIANENREKLLEHPLIILKELTHTKATFSQYDLLKCIQRRIGDDENKIRIVFEQALSHALTVGEGIDGQNRYTTKAYKKSEDQAIKLAGKLDRYTQKLESSKVHNLLETSYSYLSLEQKEAVLGLTQDDQLSILVGRAGAGKTTTLKAVAQAYLQAGHRVIGTSLSALACDNLEKETGVLSFTLHSSLYKWKNGIDTLSSRHIIMVDEAGMIGTKQWRDLLEIAHHTKAKIIAVGDDHQFKAIEAGDFFRELKDSAKSLYYLQDIRRQKEEWMKEASYKFASLEVQEALSLYERQGHVHALSNLSNEIAKAYVEKISSGKEGLVLAFTNWQCQEINSAIRGLLKAEKRIGEEDWFTMNGCSFAKDDVIVFLENNLDHTLIKNGTRGKLIDYHQGCIKVLLDNQKHITLTLKDNIKMTHGYALTTHKSQGQTVDFTLVAASSYMDAKGLYVAMTRHLESADLFYDCNEFKDFKHLTSRLSNFSSKDLVKDYTILPTHESQYHRVQEYLLTSLDLSALLKEEVIDWTAYRAVKDAQKDLGKDILNDFKTHELFVKQAGMSKEMIEITVGMKEKPLSRAQEKAKELVISYGEKAQEARNLWREIRTSHPGARSKIHKCYGVLESLRRERDALARSLHANYPLYREFVSRYSKHYGINKKTIFAQRTIKEAERRDVERPVFEPATIKDNLNARIKELAFELLGKPDRQSAREWRYGNKGSLVFQVCGAKQGLYSNFETGDFGNVITFLSKHLDCNPTKALEWAKEWLGEKSIYTKTLQRTQRLHQETWKPIFPAPSQTPCLKQTPHLSSLCKGRQEMERYAYRDINGNLLGYVVRLEDSKGNKITPTLTYCQNDQGQKEWRWKGFGESRALYGLERVKENKPVLVVEGEKTANAARQLFPEYTVVTWSGGASCVQKSDWSPLKHKDVTIWPDNDAAGRKAALKIQNILKDARIVDVLETFPHKWDLADPLPQGQTYQMCKVLCEKSSFVLKPCYKDIKAACFAHNLSFLAKETDQLLLEKFAEVLCQEWGVPESAQKNLKDKVYLASSYALWAKSKCDLEQKNQDHSQRALSIGVLCAESKLLKEAYPQEFTRLLKAFERYEEQGRDLVKIKMNEQKNKDLSKTITKEKQRGFER